jgi:hypothetical protein
MYLYQRRPLMLVKVNKETEEQDIQCIYASNHGQ